MQIINHICLSPSIAKKDHYQAVLSSQSYGTFYMVYAEFTTTEDVNNYYIQNIQLKIINYKGIINLGIEDANFKPVFDTINNKSIGGLITISLKAFEKDMFTVSNVDASHPFPKLGSTLSTNRVILPMHKNNSPLENAVFDEEFYYRDGINPRANKGLSLQKRVTEINLSDEQCIEMMTTEGFSFICPFSKGSII